MNIVLSVLFLVGAIYNFTQGIYHEAGVGFAISFVLVGLYFFERDQKSQVSSFLIWLMDNKEGLKNDKTKTLMWNNVPVKYDSYVTQYQICTSFLFVTFKEPTGYILDRSSNKFYVNFIATTVTVFMGWWGIPWGPIYTIQTIFRNLGGGVKKSIEELITELENTNQGARETNNTKIRSKNEILPKEIYCPDCETHLILSETESTQKKFFCPKCDETFFVKD